MKKYIVAFSTVIALAALLFACGSPTRSVPEIPSNGYAEAYISSDRAAFDEFKDSYTPPTQLEIFAEWGVFFGHRFWNNRTEIQADYDAAVAANGGNDPITLFDPAKTMIKEWTTEEAAGSEYIVFRHNVNSFAGYVSPEKSRGYSLEATLRSWASDNDSIGLIAAFVRGEGENYFLAVEHAVPDDHNNADPLTVDDWGISVYRSQALEDPVRGYGPYLSSFFGATITADDVLYRYQMPSLDDLQGGGWGDGETYSVNSNTGVRSSFTQGTASRSARIRIERDGNLFIFKTTRLSADKKPEAHTLAELGGWVEDYTITVDLEAGTVSSAAEGNNSLNDGNNEKADTDALNIFKIGAADAGHQYGYFSRSQQDSMWHDIEREVLIGDSVVKDKAFYIDPETLEAEVYVFENGQWKHDTEARIETFFNVPAIVKNPNDGEQSFVIDKNGNVEIYILPDA